MKILNCFDIFCRPKDKVEIEDVAKNFHQNLATGKFGPGSQMPGSILNLDIDGQFHSISDGSILLSSIASCSNTSNPSVMLTAGLLAKKAVEAGLSIPKFVKRSLSPGSGIVTSYLQVRMVQKILKKSISAKISEKKLSLTKGIRFALFTIRFYYVQCLSLLCYM